jgi:hypothetical protein
MSDVDVQWVQCAQCARHVRDSDKRCPFCERDAAASNLARPAAVVIAALVALAPLESSAERISPSPRLAQSRMTSAYGAPAPMYGLSPTPLPEPPSGRYSVEVGAVVVTPAATRSTVVPSIWRTRTDVMRCLDAEPAMLADNTMLDVRVSGNTAADAPLTVVVQPRRASNNGALRSVQACVQRSLSRVRFNVSDLRSLSLRWSYRVRLARRR